ncbi:MAG: LytTR family transcriptional regulator DNA-binding domain-containing protein [Lachnospiraceae bacterium]|nr:LytTR family transcriptional regulator DNA-binding domain-containing protein [Lachnospiraceae bacterium]
MKVTLQRIVEGTEEVLIKYKNRTEWVDNLLYYLENQKEKLIGFKGKEQYTIHPGKVIYFESVDGSTYLYTKEDVYKTNMSLDNLVRLYSEEGFFRCSKAMVLNVYRIEKLQSLSGNRIDATMDNGEHVIISRRYAKELRILLKGGAE